LEAAFRDQRDLDPDGYRALVGDRGLPLVVVLSNRAGSDGQPRLWIEDLVAVGWQPRPAAAAR
jgi:hypothetical protein